MKTNKMLAGICLLVLLTSLSACAPEGYSSHEYGFFGGIWHGFIWMFALICKIFGFDAGIYADHNTGFTYWLGFLIGIGALGGGGSSARRRH